MDSKKPSKSTRAARRPRPSRPSRTSPTVPAPPSRPKRATLLTLASVPADLIELTDHLSIIGSVVQTVVDGLVGEGSREALAVTLLECGLYPLLTAKGAVKEFAQRQRTAS